MTYAPLLLDGKIALITGAGRGLGLEMARALAQAGAHVILNGRDLARLDQAVTAINAEGGSAEAMAFDVTDENSVPDAFAAIAARHGGLDILINNVGKRDRRDFFAFALDDVRDMLEANLIAPFDLSRRAAQLMTSRGSGRIINVTSIAGPIAGGGDAAYTAAKGGLEALTRASAAALGSDNITVNAIAPGFFATEANHEKVADPEITVWLEQRTALGRWAQPNEIAGAAVFLASPSASYITGQVIVVDGGYLSHF